MTPGTNWLGALRRNRRALWGASILGLFLFVGLFGPLVAPHDPTQFLSAPNQPPSSEFWFGTTGEGKDVLSQTLVGARTSLLVGFATGISVMLIGAVVGVSAAYFGGFIDDVLSLGTNVFLILPGLPLAVVLAAYLPQGPLTIAFVLIVTGWSWNARVLRAQALTLKRRDFVSAALMSGESAWRIILIELLPNMTSLLLSGFISATTYAIGAQVGLEFLGLGDVSVVTWGTNLYWASNSGALLTGAWWTIVPTGLSIALVGFALAMLNGAVDEISNPALSRMAGMGPAGAKLITKVQRS